ncbi:hypothetical protein GGH97_003435, partial [Coemansia sp. RSA 475]
ALTKKELSPLPALRPWEAIPEGPTDYKQGWTKTQEHWDMVYLTEDIGISGEGPGFSTKQLGHRQHLDNLSKQLAAATIEVVVNSFAVLQEWADDPMDEDKKGCSAKQGCNNNLESTSAGEQGNNQGIETQENSDLARLSTTAQGIPANHCPGPTGT